MYERNPDLLELEYFQWVLDRFGIKDISLRPNRGRLRKRKKSYAKHRKETRDGQARYGRGSCLPIAQLPLTRNSVSVPAAINTAASPKPTTGETAVHTTPTEALEMNLAAPLTVPSAP